MMVWIEIKPDIPGLTALLVLTSLPNIQPPQNLSDVKITTWVYVDTFVHLKASTCSNFSLPPNQSRGKYFVFS